MGAFSRTLLAGSLAAGLAACSAVKNGAAGYDLDFSKQKYTEQNLEVNGRNVKFRAYEGIVYVGNPADAKYETINNNLFP